MGERAQAGRSGLQCGRSGHHLRDERARRLPAPGDSCLPRADGQALRRERHAHESLCGGGREGGARGEGSGGHHWRRPARRLHEGVGPCGHQGGSRGSLHGHRQARGARGCDGGYRRGLRIRRPRGRADHHDPGSPGGGRGRHPRAGRRRHRRRTRRGCGIHAGRAGRAGGHPLPRR